MMLEIEPIPFLSHAEQLKRRKEVRKNLLRPTRALPLKPLPNASRPLKSFTAMPYQPPKLVSCEQPPSMATPDTSTLPSSIFLSHGAPCTPLGTKKIMHAVASFYPVTVAEIISADRHHRIVRARQIACYLARILTQSSFPQIGRRIGGRDHTTVLHAFHRIESLLQTDELLASQIRELTDMICGRPIDPEPEPPLPGKQSLEAEQTLEEVS